MYINCIRIGENVWETFCNSCGKSCDLVSGTELSGLMALNNGLLCFDCDPVTADEIPAQLWYEEQPYFLILDGSIAVVDWPSCAQGLRDRVLHLRREIEQILDDHRRLTQDFSPFEGE